MSTEPSISVHEFIYRSLRLKIMLGQIEPGKIFSIRGLASDFCVSMTPIREATRRLVAEGALTMSNSGRIKVPVVNADRFEELSCIRLLLEPELAVRAIPRVHFALIERLLTMSKLIEDMIYQGNSLGYIKLKFEFHKTLYLRAHSPAMLALLETVWLQTGPTMNVCFQKNLKRLATSDHRNIILALRSGDGPGLAENIKRHIQTDLQMCQQ